MKCYVYQRDDFSIMDHSELTTVMLLYADCQCNIFRVEIYETTLILQEV